MKWKREKSATHYYFVTHKSSSQAQIDYEQSAVVTRPIDKNSLEQLNENVYVVFLVASDW